MRTPITLKIKFKSASLDQFIERYSVDVSRGGIFIRTKEPLAVGTQLKFEFQLQDASSLIAGEGTVVWIREHDPNRSGVAPGMGVKFDKLQPQSQQVLDKILAEKNKRGEAQMESRFDAGVRASATASGTMSSAVKAHNDFGGGDSKTHTPLPAPVPGLDQPGDEFTEESTRVMQDSVVQKLAAETRGEANPFAESEPTRRASVAQVEELAKSGTAAEAPKPAAKVETKPEPKVEAKIEAKPAAKAETKPEPKVEAKPEPKVEAKVETKPEAKIDAKVEAKPEPKAQKAPPKDAKPVAPVEKKEPAKEAPKEAARPIAAAAAPPQKRSAALPAFLVIAAVAAVGGYYAFSSGSTPDNPPAPAPQLQASNIPRKRMTLNPAALQLSNVQLNPSEGTPPPAAAPAPPSAAAGLSVPVTSDPAGAQVIVDGKPVEAPTPTTLTGLDAKKVYAVSIALKGFHSWKVKLKPKAGEKVDAALVPNEKVVTVSSTPEGAALLLDGRQIGRTPFTLRKLDLSRNHELELRHKGFVNQTHAVSASDPFETKGDRDVLALALKLEAAPRATHAARGKHPAAAVKPAATTPTVAAEGKPAGASDKPAATTAATDKPAATDTPAEQAATEKPATDKPATDQPASDKPVASDKPASDKPATDKPAASDKPAATDKPTTGKPAATDKPAIKVPTWMKPKPAEPAPSGPAPTP